MHIPLIIFALAVLLHLLGYSAVAFWIIVALLVWSLLSVWSLISNPAFDWEVRRRILRTSHARIMYFIIAILVLSVWLAGLRASYF